MKIKFSKIDIIDETAERLMRYINKSNGKFKRSKIMSNTAKNIIAMCFGHDDYNSLNSNLSSKTPQLFFLNEEEIPILKKQYLKVLRDSFRISNKLAEELWMASYPYEELGTTNKILTIGQIGRYTYEWGQPDEYGEDTEYVDVYTYVIAIKCIKCKGIGQLTPLAEEQNSDMENPPSFPFDDECDWCDGTGVFHKPDRRLNEIRLTKIELEIQDKCEAYYKALEEKIKYSHDDIDLIKEQYPKYLDRTFDEEWGTDCEGDFPLDNNGED